LTPSKGSLLFLPCAGSSFTARLQAARPAFRHRRERFSVKWTDLSKQDFHCTRHDRDASLGRLRTSMCIKLPSSENMASRQPSSAPTPFPSYLVSNSSIGSSRQSLIVQFSLLISPCDQLERHLCTRPPILSALLEPANAGEQRKSPQTFYCDDLWSRCVALITVRDFHCSKFWSGCCLTITSLINGNNTGREFR
jgi:hypothetical protein